MVNSFVKAGKLYSVASLTYWC